AAQRDQSLFDPPKVASQHSGKFQELFYPVESNGRTLNEPKPTVDPRQQLMANVRRRFLGLNRITMTEVSVEQIPSIRHVVNATQQAPGLVKKQHIAVDYQHALGLKVGDKVKDFWRKDVPATKLQANRIRCKQREDLLVGQGPVNEPRGWKVRS